MSAVLAGSDFLRAPLLAAAHPDGVKEWHHFVVHGRDHRILINVSVTDECTAVGEHRLVPRVIVIVHADRWNGVIERYASAEMEVSPDLGELTLGGNRLTVLADGYRVSIDLPRRGVRAELEFIAVTKPFVVNNQPLGAGRMSWLFVPRLRVDGWVRCAGIEHRVEHELAYHDHNWGRFWWGDDFGWTWGTVLPTDPGNPWSMVMLQMTDRSRLRYFSQAVYVWHEDEPAAIFRHAAVTARRHGTFTRHADCTLPPAMQLVLDGDVTGVPERLEVSAQRAGDAVHATFTPQSFARVAYPSEVTLDGSVVLCETRGDAQFKGVIGGERVAATGAGIFEFLYG
ncbi:hypothetical protein FK535_09655 [Mycolicibacterium sp. 018/SC-01/001]|uniref:hypothetical protein n=1 Tax=Mycolicibacterium sp. 018/SC-01/001 TaxID=2592069 RepID=UPI00117DD2D9|nr:hypothetical protein [Mycolicibacterium sp. 018/SC-01/001]TRW84749.1 hypothetical protein FK535_09655 [Mycolicibacterium sp. 018/SC-01/001]